jgi:hypothetical protein
MDIFREGIVKFLRKKLLFQDGQGRNGNHIFLEYEAGMPTT